MCVQEEITQGVVSLSVETGKMTADLLQKAVKKVLEECGVSEAKAAAFEEHYTATFGEKAELPAVNMVSNKFKVSTPAVNIQVDPEHAGLIETRMIDGRRYIVILADGDVEVNGVKVYEAPEK